ncbi:MAG: NAD(P)-dependent oxidoreductase [Trueperaceae bacterium]|nr:NAD(P)-dependent oxidoreductase [Trueperaceae bacterium]
MIVVTGSSGKAGKAIIKDLLDHGHKVLGVDMLPKSGQTHPYIQANLTDLGQCYEVLKGAESVIHMANIPAPEIHPPAKTFVDNTSMNYNIFQAATDLKLERVIWASSETTLGLPFDTPPLYAPVDEAHFPHPESSYALSKVVTEEMAAQFSRWSGLPFIGLRFSNILNPEIYKTFPETCWKDIRARKWNLWGYIDDRDVAQIARKALTAQVKGSNNYIVAANDTVMNRPSKDLMQELFPDVPLKGPLEEYGTLLSNAKAKDELGFNPEYSWRQTLDS